MGTFLNQPPRKLAVADVDVASDYRHWFGGVPDHRGIVPPRRIHPVHLLYDLDLRDPELDLASRFDGLSRLPLFNALQYTCCDLIYRVVADDAIEIIELTNPKNPIWMANHPFENYAPAFERRPIVLTPVEPELATLLSTLDDDGGGGDEDSPSAIMDELQALGYPFPQVGGKHFMWQGVPEWDCRAAQCQFAGKKSNAGKEVLAVIWERPTPELHLWSSDPKWQDVGSAQIIFSRCTACGTLHSCNRCD